MIKGAVMNEHKKHGSSFSSKMGFILAAAGSAVGLGNLWRFPYLAAKYGGGSFLLIYVILAVTFGFALMITEIALGRKTGKSALYAFSTLHEKCGFIGILASIVPIIILPYYCVIGGWVIKFAWAFLTGSGNAAAADAAAMLYAMNQLYDLGLSRRELMKRGVQIGADVPYCLMRGTALAEGIGEKLTQLPPLIKCPVLIAKPSISVSTKFVYQNLKLDEQTNHPDIDALMKDIREKDFDGVCAHMGNVLESVTIPNYPVIAEIKQQMMRSGAKASMMSGSGPTVFGLFEDGETAKRALREMKRSGLAKQVYLTTIYNNRRK